MADPRFDVRGVGVLLASDLSRRSTGLVQLASGGLAIAIRRMTTVRGAKLCILALADAWPRRFFEPDPWTIPRGATCELFALVVREGEL